MAQHFSWFASRATKWMDMVPMDIQGYGVWSIGFSGQAMYKFNSKIRAAGSGIIRRECVSKSTELSRSETVPRKRGNPNQNTKSAVWV